MAASRGWKRRFDDPISLPRGRLLVTLEDAGNYITGLPRAEHETAEWQAAMEALTTSVVGALKRGLAQIKDELGIHVCGGRGKHSRRTPEELEGLSERLGFDGQALIRASRLVAKVDSAAVQDGFDLYLHGFFVTDDGKWTVVQQGMNGERRQARRYHWHSEALTTFVEEPHSAIDGPGQGEIINLTDRRAGSSRHAQLDLL